MGISEVPIADLAPEPIERTRAHPDPQRVALHVDHPDAAPPVTIFDLDGTLSPTSRRRGQPRQATAARSDPGPRY
jgi:hypothetical protein